MRDIVGGHRPPLQKTRAVGAVYDRSRFLFKAVLSLLPLALLAILLGTGIDAQTRRSYFIDVAPQSQFNYVTHNDYRSRKYFIEPMAGGVAILEPDNAGNLDIFFTTGEDLA